MNGFTARRGLGARAVLVVALLALAFVPVSGHAATAPSLVNSSFVQGWAGPTILLAHSKVPGPATYDYTAGGARNYLPSDPPWQWSDGEVRFLLTRWNQQICDGSVGGDIAPTFAVKEYNHALVAGDGLNVIGATTVEDFTTQERQTLVRFTVNDPAYPHGLAAGRTIYAGNTQAGGGAPYAVSVTVYPRDFNGICDTSSPTTLTQTIGVDRFIPAASKITSPSTLISPVGNRNIGSGCKQFDGDPDTTGVCIDKVNIAEPQQGTVTIGGTATDPLTRPFAPNGAFKTLETSGVRAVIVRLYAAESIGACGSTDIGFCPGSFLKSYQIDNPACATGGYPVTDQGGSTISQCTDTFPYSVDITADLVAGDWYAVDAVTIDLANYRSAVDPTQPNNPDNKNEGPESNSVAFLYLG